MIKKIIFFLIRGYRRFSPYMRSLLLVQTGCLHYPSCSEYTENKIGELGVRKGLFCGMVRVLQCNPFSYFLRRF